jgi:hypothetical protein
MTLEQALEVFNAEFPGWWWTLGECHISCDASIAPDRRGPDANLLNHRFFDDGSMSICSSPQPLLMRCLPRWNWLAKPVLITEMAPRCRMLRPL